MRESAARWCPTCESWSVHEKRIEGAAVEIRVACVTCGAIAERRRLELPKRVFTYH